MKNVNFGGANVKTIMAEEKTITNYKNIPEKDWDIFISWHDDKGKSPKYGEQVKMFLDAIFDNKKNIFFSADIPSGQWREHVKEALEQSKFLIILLTNEALESGWVHAEYGAFYMKVLKNEISHKDIYALKLPGTNTSSTKSPIKDNEINPIDKGSALLSFLKRIDEKCNHLLDFYSIFKANIAQIKSYDDPTIKEYVYETPQPVAPVSTHTAPTSIDDISFDSIDFNYNKPKNKNFFGRDAFIKKLRDCFLKGENSLNVVATGGMGKTSVAHRYIEVYGDTYKEIQFVTSNDDICQDFNRELRRCIKRQVPDNDIIFQKNENDAPFITSQIDLILGKAPNDCLLIIDVNIDKEGLVALKLSNAETKWHVLYLSRKRINGTLSDGFELPNFENDLIAARELFCSVYKPDWFDEEKEEDISKLNNLFELVYYHPLLIEQLAVYGKDGDSTYDELCEVVSKSRIENEMTKNPDYCKYSTCFLDKENTIDVCLYLKQLISFKQFEKREDIKYVLQHFILWQYDYISLDSINQLLKKEDKSNFKRELNYLTDRVILSSVEFKKDDEGVRFGNKKEGLAYRIHGLLADNLKNEIREQFLDFDYSNYISNVKYLIEHRWEINRDSDAYKCICKTPLEIFGIGSTKDCSVYENWHFLRDLASFKVEDFPLSELSYKAYLLKEFYNDSGEGIYHKVYGEYKDVSSYVLYYKWLENRKKYGHPLPPEQTENGITFIPFDFEGVKFKMIKVTPDYYLAETQVTEELWKKVIGTNRIYYVGNKKATKEYPAVYVSFYDCMDFIIKLNKVIKLRHFKFRLPSTKEWKYAASCREKVDVYEGVDDIEELRDSDVFEKFAEYDYYWQCRHIIPHKVKDQKHNDIGLYDMTGNGQDWCLGSDYIYPFSCVCCGFYCNEGIFKDTLLLYRNNNLSKIYPENFSDNIGFRLALSSKHP